MKDTWFIIDFDSTFTSVEAMEELAAISLKNDPDRDEIIGQVKHLTDLAMEGKMPFNKSLRARIELLSAKKYHISMLVNRLRKKISPSIARNKKFFRDHPGKILVVSGGFREFIEPVLKPYDIPAACIFANTFGFDKKNNIIGADEGNPLSQPGGKVSLVKKLKLPGRVIVIGDGYTDYEIRAAGEADMFFAYTENIARERVIEKADFIAPSFDEVLYRLKLPMSLSYPKSRMKVMLLGPDTFAAEQAFKLEGYQVEKIEKVKKTDERLKEASIVMIDREAGNLHLKTSRLLAVGCWHQATSHIDEPAMQRAGIPVFHAPHTNTRSLAELALTFLLQLNRFNSAPLSVELRGSRLGLIGYGHAGNLTGILAQGLGMEVIYYDEKDRVPGGNAIRCRQLHDVLKKADHVVVISNKPGKLIGEKELKMLAPSALLINLSSDDSVDIAALKNRLKNKQLKGFAMDCRLEETYESLRSLPLSQITLKQRYATVETRDQTAAFLSERIIQYINTGDVSSSVNFPQVQLPALDSAHRFIHIHENRAGMMAKINAVLSAHGINIVSQFLKTQGEIGYVITDVSKKYESSVIDELKKIKGTVRFRTIY